MLEGGAVFEKAGVNFSEVFGEFSPEFAKSMPGDGLRFTATGIPDPDFDDRPLPAAKATLW